MFSLARVQLPAPVTLLLPAGRSRVGGGTLPGTMLRRVAGFDACFRINPVTLTIHAELPPLPRALLIYGAADFASAAAETPVQHADRVLEILGADPAAVLQSLIDGRDLPAPPPRVPREVSGWRVKSILAKQGLLATVDAAVDAVAGPDGDTLRRAWYGGAMLDRHSATVTSLASGLGLDSAALDAFFIAAAAISV